MLLPCATAEQPPCCARCRVPGLPGELSRGPRIATPRSAQASCPQSPCSGSAHRGEPHHPFSMLLAQCLENAFQRYIFPVPAPPVTNKFSPANARRTASSCPTTVSPSSAHQPRNAPRHDVRHMHQFSIFNLVRPRACSNMFTCTQRMCWSVRPDLVGTYVYGVLQVAWWSTTHTLLLHASTQFELLVQPYHDRS